MIGTNFFSVFFDIEFEYEVSFSLAIAVSVAEGRRSFLGPCTLFIVSVYGKIE
jgi:hypothetical protein